MPKMVSVGRYCGRKRMSGRLRQWDSVFIKQLDLEAKYEKPIISINRWRA